MGEGRFSELLRLPRLMCCIGITTGSFSVVDLRNETSLSILCFFASFMMSSSECSESSMQGLSAHGGGA